MPVSIERGLGGVARIDAPNKKESKIIFQNIKKDFPIYRGGINILKSTKKFLNIKRANTYRSVSVRRIFKHRKEKIRD